MQYTHNKKGIAFTSMVIVALFIMFGASAANAATYTKVLPNGLGSKSSVAKNRVQALVQNDGGIQDALSRSYGLTADEIADARVSSIRASKTKVGAAYDNTARATSSGAIVPTSYMYGQTVASWTVKLRVSGSKTVTVRWKKDCSNPFLKKGTRKPPLRIHRYSKSFMVKFSKKKTTSKTVTCPSGQAITVKVVSKVSGKVRVKSLTKAVKVASQKLSAKAEVDVKNTITVSCATLPPGPVSPNPVPVISCPVNYTVTVNGACQANSSSQDATVNNDCKGPNVNSSQCNTTITQTTIQINANCSMIIYGDGSSIYVQNGSQVNICSSTEVAPPPPPADRPPHVDVYNTPAHLYVNGVFYLYIEAYDEDGDSVSVSTSASGQGTITLPTPSSSRWDGSPCPSGVSCYRARVQAASAPGALTLTATVNANGKSETKSVTLPVVPDQF